MKMHYSLPLLAAIVGSLTGCSTVSTTEADGRVTVRSRDEFESYVESVFRMQNRVGNDLITLSGSVDELPLVLQSAEENMIERCHALNEIVVASAEGRAPGMAQKSALMKSIGSCDRAVHDLAALLQNNTQASAIEVGQHL